MTSSSASHGVLDVEEALDVATRSMVPVDNERCDGGSDDDYDHVEEKNNGKEGGFGFEEALERAVPMEKIRNGWSNACEFFGWSSAVVAEKSRVAVDAAKPAVQALSSNVQEQLKRGYAAASQLYEKGAAAVAGEGGSAMNSNGANSAGENAADTATSMDR